jgi:hypothetical protein
MGPGVGGCDRLRGAACRPLCKGTTSPYRRGRVRLAYVCRAPREPDGRPGVSRRRWTCLVTGTGDPAVDADELDTAVAETVRRTGTSIGARCLLAPDEQLLVLDVLCGAPAEFAAP